MTRTRTLSACLNASDRDLRAYPVPENVIDVLPDEVLFGADYEAAMVAKYGNDWENMK